MRRILLIFICVSISYFGFNQNGAITNGDFENWSTTVLADTLDDWSDSNNEAYGSSTYTVFKSSDAADGDFSAMLTAATFGAVGQEDTIFGYIYHGVIDDAPSGGIPYTAEFDEIKFQYKGNLVNNDSLFLLMIRYNSGNTIDMQLIATTGGQTNDWTQGSVSVNNIGAHDELFIGFILSNPFDDEQQPSPDSEIYIDDIRIFNQGSGTTDLPDPSLENWSPINVVNPNNWYTLNDVLIAGGFPENATKTSDAANGSFAIEMSVLFNTEDQDTITSFVSLGEISIDQDLTIAGIPYSASPETFSGSYKYAPVNTDSAVIILEFYANNTLLETKIQPLTEQGNYTDFNLSLDLNSVPDSIVLYVYAGSNPGSVLKLDDLQLNGGNVSTKEVISNETQVYPNPTKEILYLRTDLKTDFQVIDITGKEVATGTVNQHITPIDLSHVNTGTYFIKVTQSGNAKSIRFIKQ